MRIKEILNTLHSIKVNDKNISQPMICGGIPRDKIIGHAKSKFEDLDITTGDKSVRLLADTFATTMSHDFSITKKVAEDGHVSVKLGDFKVDFSSNFISPDIDGLLKNKNINNPTNMQKEMFSRDFTCNALLLSLDLKKIEDPTNMGLKDIKNKFIRTCFEPEITLKYNVNRIPRVIYIAAKLGFEVDPAIMTWIRNNLNYAGTVKPRYMLEKIERAFEFDPDRSAALIDQAGLWSLVPASPTFDNYRKEPWKQK